MSASAKETEVPKVGPTATVSRAVYCAYSILPLGIVACTFFPTTFLEIAVYKIFFDKRRSKLYRQGI